VRYTVHGPRISRPTRPRGRWWATGRALDWPAGRTLREPKVGGRPMRSPLGDECHQSYICARLFCIQPMADSRARVPVLEKYPAPSSVCPFIVLMITYSFGYKFTVCCSSAMAPTRPASDHLTRGKDHQHNITLFQARPSYARISINTKRSSVQPDRVQEGFKLLV
jgi:hypothetical protein